jgi:hypothetical protein
MIELISRKLKEQVPRPCAPMQRLSTILRENVGTILSRTLVDMKASPDLAALPLSDEERIDMLDNTIRELADHLDSDLPSEGNEVLIRAARLRGETGQKQHYSIRLIVEKKRILARVINNVIHDNLLSVNLSFLLLDLNKLNDAMLFQLEESIEAYLRSEGEEA